MPKFARDLNAIQNLKAHYCASTDSAAHDIEGARRNLLEMFTEGVEGDYGVAAMSGAAALADFLCEAVAGNSVWMLHMLHSPRIEIEGDSARGEWTVMVHVKRKTTGLVEVVIGRYNDEFVSAGNGWRISKVRFQRLE